MIIRPFLPIYVFICFLCLLVPSLTAQAHWTRYTGAERNSTVAEIWIETNRITLQLEISDQDREAFAALLNDNSPKKDYFHHGLVLTANDSMPLIGEVKLIEQRPRTDRSTSLQPAADAMRSPIVTYAEIVYALSERPATLSLTPPLRDGSESAADIGFILYHQSIPVIDFQDLQRRETLRLDWRDPWYSAFDNPNLQRHHRAPLMTFLYIEPYEVRFEMLIRLKTLASWMPLEVQNRMHIDSDERGRLREQIGQFFLQHSQVRIDDTPPQPILDRVQFITITQKGIQPLDAAERLTLNTALVGIILAYITPGPPQKVTVDWALFNDRVLSVPSTVIDPVSQLPYDLTPAQPTLSWTNRLANHNYHVATIDAIDAKAADQVDLPLPSLLLCLAAILLYGFVRHSALKGAYGTAAITLLLVTAVVMWPFGRITLRNPLGTPSRLPVAKAEPILRGLLQNTYRAFDFRAEDDVYDKLAVSVAGDLITDIYLQSRKRLAVAEQSGARATVQEVELLDVTQIELPGDSQRLTFQCAWRIAGSVGHWGHIHWRRNQYEALITIQPIDQTWKIVALDLIDERRLP